MAPGIHVFEVPKKEGGLRRLLDNRISLYKLEVFCHVVELGGVSRTAEHLRVAQPAITAHIRSLEKRLSVKLLYRSGRSVFPTEEGLYVYRWASEIASRAREMEREIAGLSDGTKGSVVVSSSMSAGSYILPEILSQFVTTYPDARIMMFATDPQEAAEATKGGICDFALVIADELESESELEAEQLGEEELLLVAAPNTEPVEDNVPRDRLTDLPFVSPPLALQRRRMEDRQLWKLGISQRRVVIELGHPEAMKTAAQRGLGIAMLFRSAVEDDLANGSLREVRIDSYNRMSLPVLLIRRRDKHFSPLQQLLYDTVKDRILGSTRQSALSEA